MKKLHIMITGGPNTGKTTIAREIAALISDLKFNVLLSDDATGEEVDSELHHKRLEALREASLSVDISSLQITAYRRRCSKDVSAPTKKLFAVFCCTPIGNCVALVSADNKSAAKDTAATALLGDDIGEITIHKIEEIDMEKEDGAALFWDNELETGEEGPR